MKKRIIIILMSLVIVLLAPFVIEIVSLEFSNSDLFDTYVESDSDSIDGTYTWTNNNGWITMTVDIYGDTWYSEIKIGPHGERKNEFGKVKGNSLYSSHAEWIEVGWVDGKTLMYGGHPLRKL